jgi:hypothetical protein
VDTWNRVTSVRIELARHHVTPERRAVLEARLESLHAEQDRLEIDMTRASRQWSALAEASTPRRGFAPSRHDERQPGLFEALSA